MVRTEKHPPIIQIHHLIENLKRRYQVNNNDKRTRM